MAQRIGGPIRRDRIPGLWKHLQQSQIDEIRRGDARGFGMSEDAKATLNDHPNSTVTQARAVLAGMDRGDAMLSWPPTARQFREVAEIRWLASVSRIWVRADDSIEPAGG